MRHSTKAIWLLFALLLSNVSAMTRDQQPDVPPEPEFADIDEDHSYANQGRTLADVTYPALRIYPFYSRLTDATPEFQDYLQNVLVPPIISYFQATLTVKYPLTGKLSFRSSVTTMCGQTTPQELINGIDADLAYFFTVNPQNDSSTVASSYACFLSSASSRPIVATTWFNTVIFKPTTDVLLHEKNTYMLMHEITHSLGFASGMYKYFLDANGNRLTGHIKNGTLNGDDLIILDVAPLTSRIRSFFGCSSIEGAYMENSGSDGTAGSHFERRQFIFEAMSSPLIYQQSYSQFTLALLEGSGWYAANYSMADPYWFGKGQGCNFLTGNCTNNGGNYEEWCTGYSRGCTDVGRGGGTCSPDIRSDSCRYQYPNVNYDCENDDYDNYARFPTFETFGRTSGGKCFSGTLSSKSTGTTATSFCFKPTCSGTGLNTTVTLKVNTTTVTCKTEGALKVTGYYGVINCPDPLTFCSTVGQAACPRGCMGRGQCVKGKCVCNTGFTGTDCGWSA